MKRLLITLSIVSMLSACTQRDGDYNHHETTPSLQEEGGLVEQSSSMIDAADAIENFRGEAYSELYAFYKKYLTEEFFLKESVEKDPDNLRALNKFHLKFISDYSLDAVDKEKYSNLSLEYYRHLKKICNSDFSTCPAIKIYASTIYAADVFLRAEPYLRNDEKDAFLLFVTTIGHPENNIHILQKKLKSSIDKIKEGKIKDSAEIENVINLMIYLTAKTNKVQTDAIKTILDFSQKNNQFESFKASIENVISISLDENPSPELVEISDNYIQKIVQQNPLYIFMNKPAKSGLITWQKKGTSNTFKGNWKLYFSFMGLLNSQYASQLHNYTIRKFIKDDNAKKEILNLAEAYIFKKLVSNVYKSHEIIGDLFTKELNKLGKVEAIFADFFSKADGELADMWINKFKREVEYLKLSLAKTYDGEELYEIKRVITNLDRNIRNLVMMPSLYIIGYHAVKQGNFDLQVMGQGGVIYHIDDKVYFRDLVEGRFPTFFQFLPMSGSTAQENIMSLYFSIDEKILESYGIDFSFIDSFVNRYIETEQSYLTYNSQRVDNFFAPNTLASEMMGRCDKIEKSNYNFSYDKNFAFVDNSYFLGDVYYNNGGSRSWGTTRDMRDYVLYFNGPEMKDTLSEAVEMLRLDIGPKINHLRIFRQALLEQSRNSDAEKVEKYINLIVEKSNNYIDKAEIKFKESIECYYKHGQVESNMRTYYFQKEINYIKSTYKALELLNKYKDSMPDLSTIRSENKEYFSSDYLKDLPLSGDFLVELNKRWLNIGRSLKDNIVDYVQESESLIGFKKNNSGKYILKTNKYEDYFRKIEFMTDSKVSGVKFPKMNILEIPKSYKQLDIIFNEKDDHYYSWEIKNTEKNIDDFVFKILTVVHGQKAGRGTLFELESTIIWKYTLMNLASISKYRAHSLFSSDFNYKSYKEKLSKYMADDFEYMSDVTNKVLELINIDEEEEEIINAMSERSFLRSSENRIYANRLFVYYPGTEYLDLGQYDVFFSALVSYRLGNQGIFREQLFGYGNNILVYEFLPRDNPAMDGKLMEVAASKLIKRRKLLEFSIKNFKIAEQWDEIILFDLNDRSRNVILHDLLHPVVADHALADSFIEWVQGREAKGIKKVPYDFDLLHYKEPNRNPHYILPTVLQRYRDTRRQFDAETGNVFKKLWN